MKKTILMLAAVAAVFAACSKKEKADENFVATFEEAAISPAELDSEYKLDTTGTFQSGNFIFKQTAMPSQSYYSCNVVSNHEDTTFADWNDAWKSAVGGAYEGKNYVVWNMDYYGADTIKLVKAAKVPGLYVTNCIYAYNTMKYGDWSGEPFSTGDKFLLTITGVLDGKETSKVEFYLAVADKILDEWEYLDLSTLNEVDGLVFSLSGSRNGDYGLLTPAYFAFDNLGAKK